MNRAWYKASKETFIQQHPNTIIGALSINSAHDGFDVTETQTIAWQREIEILQSALDKLPNIKIDVFMEFNIPRMGRRIDVLLLIHSDKPHIVILEFKVGQHSFASADIDQVVDYALEMKNFHEGSHTADLFPIVVASQEDSPLPESFAFAFDHDGIAKPVCIGPKAIEQLLLRIVYTPAELSAEKWEASPYTPTPTLIEAARVLYSTHNVHDITRSEGSAINISETSACINEIIEDAKANHKKKICFVTGVPGAGKTLVGLNIAAARETKDDDTKAVFLSGNGPLVKVLIEALVRDKVERDEAAGITTTKKNARVAVKSFIQNIHHFRDEAIKTDPQFHKDLDIAIKPFEHVCIFDEAQRCWDSVHIKNWMKSKKGISEFNSSEGEYLISYLDRHTDFAVIVCLVGGGQEINSGEAGISIWIQAILEKYPEWEICLSGSLTDSEYMAGDWVQKAKEKASTKTYESLHLSVSMRSFRAEHVSNFVKALLDLDQKKAREYLQQIKDKYPICITRNLLVAKEWVRKQVRGSERPGMLASSKGLRLKPFAIDVKTDCDPIHYFLGDKTDVRSSYFLESTASEFDVQGLELDYTLVAWDGDFRITSAGRWSHHNFSNKWQNIKNEELRKYQKNAYRVLLTRARQGMVIFVPHGNNPPDKTRDASFYDETYKYLKSLGLTELEADVVDKGY
jgi:hypothetical protein